MATVLVGVDNSDASTRAVEFATERAKLNDWDVVVAHVIRWSPFSFTTPTENEERPVERKHELEAAESQIIAPMKAIVEGAGVPVSTVVKHGNPSETMVDIGEEHGAIHIIVGRTGDSGLRDAVFGSVASRLVQQANVPVTVVP